MFGYVNVYKDLLRIRDYNIFRAYYCGLCRQLGKSFNTLTRLGLSYDMTFLAILISSLEEKMPAMKAKRCLVHPFAKRAVAENDYGIEYAADMSVILTYLKLKDDWNDEKSFKSLFRVFYFFPYKKSASKHAVKFRTIDTCMKELGRLESENCPSPDMAADCFGRLLECVFDISGGNRPLAWLGYNIGRYIYLADALSDMADDIKTKSYNPFFAAYGEKCLSDSVKSSVKDSLLLTLTEISNAYNLLKIRKNKEILDNIIYIGLRNSLENF